jgi:4-diphosphocytidyl-2-C-methyl-D-erythritol kinase
LNGQPGRANRLIDALQASTGEGAWAGQLYNSLEAPAFWKYPVLQLYVEEFKKQGALAAMMSGSGSTVFAWFGNRLMAEQGLEQFRSRFGDRLWSVILP